MNIQIFGKNKCFTTKAAERFFKERRIKYQFIDILEKSMSPKELEKILIKVKDIDKLVDNKSLQYEKTDFGLLRTNEMKKKILIENPSIFLTPIVRDCETGECTVGANESVWKTWIK